MQNKYSFKTKIGNWSEDLELYQTRLKEYLYRKEHNQALVDTVRKAQRTPVLEVPLSRAQDGYVRFGDHVMIYSAKTEGVLACDPADKPDGFLPSFTVTTTASIHSPIARSVFVIEPYDKDAKAGDLLRLGQPFRLRANPVICQEPYYLQSQPVSTLAASKISGQQLVCFAQVTSYDTAWKATFKNVEMRFEMEGEPVPAGAEIIINHAATGQGLSSDKLNYMNDFGLEYEVSAKTSLRTSKNRGLQAEVTGKITGDVPHRQENSQNFWAFLYASDPEEEKQNSAPAAEVAQPASPAQKSSPRESKDAFPSLSAPATKVNPDQGRR